MYQLAEINVGRMIGLNIEDPIMKEFVDNLESVNKLAESSEGFIWRLKDEDNNATAFNPFNDEQVIVNISVWKDISSLEKFTYKTLHTSFLKRKKEWFTKYGKVHIALWWIEEGKYPSIKEAVEKLEYLQANGPSEHAFSFKVKFPKPKGIL